MKIIALYENNEDIKMLDSKTMKMMEDDGEYKHCIHELKELLYNQPEHWKEYIDNKKFDALINMQIEELMEAKRMEDKEKMKMEYLHAAAAFMIAYHHCGKK